jgi:hypothetical protein
VRAGAARVCARAWLSVACVRAYDTCARSHVISLCSHTRAIRTRRHVTDLSHGFNAVLGKPFSRDRLRDVLLAECLPRQKAPAAGPLRSGLSKTPKTARRSDTT